MKFSVGIFAPKLSGSAGDITASSNATSQYFRLKGRNKNPQTPDQMRYRNMLGKWANNWGDLTDAQRESWNSSTDQMPYQNSLSQTVQLSGFNLYVKINTNLEIIGSTPIDSFPQKGFIDGMTELTSGSATAATGVISIVFAATPTVADVYHKVFCTKAYSPGKKFVKNKFRLLKILAPAEASPLLLTAEYLTKFGVFYAGQKIKVRVVAVDGLTGIQNLGLEIVLTAV